MEKVRYTRCDKRLVVTALFAEEVFYFSFIFFVLISRFSAFCVTMFMNLPHFRVERRAERKNVPPFFLFL